MKIIKSLILLTPLLSLSCGQWSIGSLDLKAVALTKIDLDKITSQSKIKWNLVSGAEYYELARIENGKEIILNSNKKSKDINFYIDNDIKMNSKYKYRLYALDINNKPISKGETSEIVTFSTSDIQEPELTNYNLIEKNKVSREEKMKWLKNPNVDFYYSIVKDTKNNKQIFGVFSKDSTVDLNTYVPDITFDFFNTEIPIIVKNGFELNNDYKFSVYSIKTNSKEIDKINSMIMKQSKEILLTL
ncbi:MAG: hypothetical protein U0457_06825 [Candidatus Sericytochromatia bacterium]